MSKYTPQEVANMMKTHGFNIVAITVHNGEGTYYFNSIKESQRAWDYFVVGKNALNQPLLNDGWFYGIEEKEENEYEVETELQYI